MNIEHWLSGLFPIANCQLVIDHFALIFYCSSVGFSPLLIANCSLTILN